MDADKKITDIMKEHGESSDKPWCAFEYFPPRTASGVEK